MPQQIAPKFDPSLPAPPNPFANILFGATPSEMQGSQQPQQAAQPFTSNQILGLPGMGGSQGPSLSPSDGSGGGPADSGGGPSTSTVQNAVGGALKGIGSIFSSDQAAKQYGQNLGIDQTNQGLQAGQSATQGQAALLNDLTQRQAAGLNSTQMDPYLQQKSLAKAAMLSALAQAGPGQVTGSQSTTPWASGVGQAASQFLNPTTLANAAGNFEKARANVDPTANTNNLGFNANGSSASGLGQAGQDQMQGISDARQASGNEYQAATTPIQQQVQQALQTALSRQAAGIQNQDHPQGTSTGQKIGQAISGIGGGLLGLIGL